MTERGWRVGIDAGGAFTDIVVLSGDGRVASAPTNDALAALGQRLEAIGLAWDAVGDLVHGATRITNAIVEGHLAHVTLIATEGFGDVLAMGRQATVVAGGTGPTETPVWEIPADGFRDVLVTNVMRTFLPMKQVLPTMIAQRYGKVVNIGGTSGLRGYRYRAGYNSSKWGVRGLTRTGAIDVGEHNVNVVCPGIVETPRMRKLVREKAWVRGWSEGKVDKEYAVLFLTSDLSKNIADQELTVYGGWDV